MRELTDDGGTGDAQVDEAVRTLQALDELPVHEHAPLVERVHQVLQDRLAGEPDAAFEDESDLPGDGQGGVTGPQAGATGQHGPADGLRAPASSGGLASSGGPASPGGPAWSGGPASSGGSGSLGGPASPGGLASPGGAAGRPGSVDGEG
ncbi:hypothetical protein [Jiangella rhizosphaerae]|uniref:hypothetical protein n=1 Tax=Jiangella rhizosphaerae TaxID=2293569 RepID=UPI00131481C3|nr:hypothetical protein [Jiangella rhizosphaerae]